MLSAANEGCDLATWRNKKILAYAKDAPHCMSCGQPNNGNVVACHSNQQRDGKGTGIKANDYRVAYMCDVCHYDVDDGSRLRRDERREIWEDAHRKTIGWLIETGRLVVA